jgi:hypothetical protein
MIISSLSLLRYLLCYENRLAVSSRSAAVECYAHCRPEQTALTEAAGTAGLRVPREREGVEANAN